MMFRSLLLICYFFSLFAVPGRAAPTDLLAGGTWYLQKTADSDAALATVPDANAPGGGKEYQQITVNKAVDPVWQTLFGQTVASAVPPGDQLRLHFWARSSTLNPMRVVVEQAGAPYTGVAEIKPTLTKEWKEYVATGSPPAFGLKGLGVKFQIGQQVGVIELAGIRLDDLGPDPAYVAARTAIQPAAIQARIEKYRKGDLTVSVQDVKGHPVKNASVSVQQTRHAFLFGANIFGLNPADTSATQKGYQERFTRLLNYATLPFYYGAFEGTQGKPDYARLDTMAQWCAAHNIATKGHPLVWHEVWPAWAPKDADASIPLLHQRVTDIVTHYKPTIHIWDVVNEANGPDVKTGEGAWIARDGAAKVVGTALTWARAAGQGTPETFLYNDYNMGDANVALLTQMQKDGHLPDVIGLQSHMHGGVWPMQQVWATCERFAQFGRPLHFTETTVLSGPKPTDAVTATNWVTTPEGENSQADYVAQFYTLLFSHPSVRGITWWDLSDLNAWQNAPAGLIRKDMSPKPAYTRLMTLIHHDWWTSANGRTDGKGHYKTRAFYGDYTLTATDSKGRTVTQILTFPEGSPPRNVTLTLP
ncbi:MAG: endo-1,4-beta-xylanase [Armatimonadota bacterium]|nr:endo-1,4-beta-xylanase [Armatimonadota bacterium]